jgi:hypothetical protein
MQNDERSVFSTTSAPVDLITLFESGEGATDASDEVRSGIAECVGDDSCGGEVVAESDAGELFDEAVTIGVTLAGVGVGDVNTPLMVGLVYVLRSLVGGAI